MLYATVPDVRQSTRRTPCRSTQLSCCRSDRGKLMPESYTDMPAYLPRVNVAPPYRSQKSLISCRFFGAAAEIPFSL